ncbi:hypothetical protein [Nonomuraea sp. NPDC049646]|uniref:hypothetical protein n=1 Tax=unclassified Nonomuraea TaxID=2593643 RepID=UPI0037A4B30C
MLALTTIALTWSLTLQLLTHAQRQGTPPQRSTPCLPFNAAVLAVLLIAVLAAGTMLALDPAAHTLLQLLD